jgi:hypothetical protein
LSGSGRRRFAALAAVVVACTLLLGGCAGGGASHHAKAVVLDGRPRYPDDEGLLKAVNTKELRIDGRRYQVSQNIQAFSSSTTETVSLLSRLGQYAQVGVNGKKVVWIAMYSAAAELPGRPKLAFHVGTLVRVDKGRGIFKDGSVLKLGSSQAPANLPASVRAEIDVARHRVDKLIVVSL